MLDILFFSGRDSRPLWDSDGQRETASGESSVRRPSPTRPLGTFDYDPMPYLPSAYQAPTAGGVKKKEGESYKEISRRLDCKFILLNNIQFLWIQKQLFTEYYFPCVNSYLGSHHLYYEQLVYKVQVNSIVFQAY